MKKNFHEIAEFSYTIFNLLNSFLFENFHNQTFRISKLSPKHPSSTLPPNPPKKAKTNILEFKPPPISGIYLRMYENSSEQVNTWKSQLAYDHGNLHVETPHICHYLLLKRHLNVILKYTCVWCVAIPPGKMWSIEKNTILCCLCAQRLGKDHDQVDHVSSFFLETSILFIA